MLIADATDCFVEKMLILAAEGGAGYSKRFETNPF